MSATAAQRPDGAARATTTGALAGVLPAVRLELARLATVRSTAVLVAVAALVGAAGAAGFAELSARTDLGRGGLLEALTAGSAVGVCVTGVLAAAGGALLVAGDQRHGAARAALLLVPRRAALVAGRGLVVALGSAVLAAVTVVAAAATTLVWPGEQLWAESPRPVVLAVPLLGFAVLVVLHGLLGAALASLLRSAAAAVAVVVAWPLVLEPLLGLVVPGSGWGARVDELLPAASAVRLVALPPVAAGLTGALETATAGAALAAVVGAVGAVAAVRFARRDA